MTAVTVRAFHASSPWDVLPHEDLQSASNDDSKKEGRKKRDDKHDGFGSDPAVSVSVQGLDFSLAPVRVATSAVSVCHEIRGS